MYVDVRYVGSILLPFFPDVFTKKELFIQSYAINPILYGFYLLDKGERSVIDL